jgi:hypothetical protein
VLPVKLAFTNLLLYTGALSNTSYVSGTRLKILSARAVIMSKGLLLCSADVRACKKAYGERRNYGFKWSVTLGFPRGSLSALLLSIVYVSKANELKAMMLIDDGL